MATPYVNVNYKDRKAGSATWNHASWAGNVTQQSETIVMQKLRDQHKACDVELTAIKWK